MTCNHHTALLFETSEILFLAYESLKIFLGMDVNLARVSKAQGFAGRASIVVGYGINIESTVPV